MLHVLRIIFIFFISTPIYSQSLVFSRNYFRWPVNDVPGIAANFGELRSGHWHMGLDVRTNHRVNRPVFAAADGYIARVSVHAFGYGQAIYINHPNGLTTVYGHLNKFNSRLDSLVKASQHQQQSWDIELNFSKDQVPVKKGQEIALSGSTGSSGGPHLHFEIRDTRTERCINPLLFSLPLADATPPVLTKLALYNRSTSVYNQTPRIFRVKKLKNKYTIRDTLIKTPFTTVGFGIGAFDCVDGAANPNGIYSGQIYLDGQQLITFQLDSMDYNETDYVNAHVDYKYKYNGGSYIQELFKLPGDRGRAYKPIAGDGNITLRDSKIHTVRIRIADVNGNESELKFKLQFYNAMPPIVSHSGAPVFAPNRSGQFIQRDFEAYLPADCIFDTTEIIFSRNTQALPGAISSQFNLCNASIPFYDKINIRIKPVTEIAPDMQNKLVIQRKDKGSTNFQRAELENGWVVASFREFGSFQAFVDTQAPTINELGSGDTVDLSGASRIAFYPQDNSGIKSFRAELDGNWLMFTNDKGAAWIYDFDQRRSYGVHHLKVKIEDIAGNVTEKDWWFKRSLQKIQKNKTATLKKTVSAKRTINKKAKRRRK